MEIKHVIDSVFQYRSNHPEATEEEIKLHACKALLEELKGANAEELLPHFRSMDLKKKERQIEVCLSFPWEVTFSNILSL